MVIHKIEFLAIWTPFLIEGLGLNFLMSILASVFGSALAVSFVLMRNSRSKAVQLFGGFVPTVVRGAPTLFLLFYLAIILPNEIVLFSESFIIPVPLWVKATIALSASPFAFTAWNFQSTMDFWKADDKKSALLFLPNWLNSFLITFLASSGASLIGVSELVGRSNSLISANNDTDIILIYGYTVCLFLLVALIMRGIIHKLHRLFLDKIS